MHTFRVLVAGWLIGGAVIVLLCIPALRGRGVARAETASSSIAASAIPVSTPASRARAAARPSPLVPADTLQVPVLGVAASDLHDTYLEARGGGRQHRAIDILAPRGTPVVAAVDGTIRKLDQSKAGGISIYQFDRAEQRVYYYAHLDRYADGLQEGEAIARGTVIGYVGTTGNAPPGTPHLHFSIEDLPPTKEWWKGASVNPYPLFPPR